METIRETFTAHKYEIREDIESRIAKGIRHSVLIGTICPRCYAERRPALGHGEDYTCSCGLKLTLHGNALECVLAEVPS